MASESASGSQRTTNDAPAPPRLPPPTGLQLPHQHQPAYTRPWSSSGAQHQFPAFGLEVAEPRVTTPRHLRLPPLDTSHATISHRPLSHGQLHTADTEYHPSKKRRVEVSQGSVSPNLVSREILVADASSRLRTLPGGRDKPVRNSSFH